MNTGIRQTGNGLQRLTDMIARGKSAQASFARVYDLYQRLQIQRFVTSGSSEGENWPALNPVYAKYKTRRYGGGIRRKSKKHAAGHWNSYPFGGTQMMVGTGALAGAAVGPNKTSPFITTGGHRALFTSKQMVISVAETGENPDGEKFEYPHYANEKRPFMSFGPNSILLMKNEVRKYLLGQK